MFRQIYPAALRQASGYAATRHKRATMNPNYLDFEQPIAELEAKIEELQLVGNDNNLNIGDEITKLRDKSTKLTEKSIATLTPGRSYGSRAIRESGPMRSIIFRAFSPTSTNCTAIATLATTAPIVGGIAP